MRGALLRSGKSETFTALGETGQPVYRAALQLREAIRRKDPGLVEHLAIPQSDELGNRIDWYSGITGDVIPWTSATEEERAPARQQLERLKSALDDLSGRYLGSEPGEQQGDKAVFGKLLKRVVYFPDESFVYLVNGKPVLTFWGFQHADADRSLEPLHCLYPPVEPPTPSAAAIPAPAVASAPAVAAVEPVPPVGRPWWRRWWWLWPLLLLLLALLLLSLLRGCMPSANLPGLPQVSLPSISAPELPSLSLPTGGLGANGSGGGAGADAAGAPGTPGGDAESPATEPPESNEPEPNENPGKEPPAEPEPEPEQPVTEPEAEATEPQARPEPPQLPEDPQEPLTIPDGQDGNSSADFLNGDWRAGAGIQDRRTGKPLRLQYRFDDGKGEVTVRRPDGVSCSGPVTAAMNDGSLAIDSQGQAVCGDGSHYDMPQVTCAQGAQNIADCTGNYGSESFPMSMRRAGE